MATEPTDINEYRRRKVLRERAFSFPAFFPEPSNRHPNIIFSNPEEWEVIACGLGALMNQINHAAADRGHTVVIFDCTKLKLSGWHLSVGVVQDERVVSLEDPDSAAPYYAIIDNWNSTQKSRWT